MHTLAVDLCLGPTNGGDKLLQPVSVACRHGSDTIGERLQACIFDATVSCLIILQAGIVVLQTNSANQERDYGVRQQLKISS